ncbi:MAG TPA: molybdopterin-dependent oxidoreductase [Frankiaceae bacterium]|jgi:anaerobic selenocysteine-containing dehydrogenase|nr:molybdopterin-dependent oxidoreductase [Frankiaceae bacterium]
MTLTETTHLRTCPLCEAMCGLEITVRGDEVTRIRPHKEDVFSKGHICPKGTTLGQLHSDPTRLRGPVVRDGDGFREVSWEEAFETCERLIHGVVAEHGKEALTAFVGNPAAHAFSIGRYLGIMIGMGGIPHIYSSGTVDQWPKNVTAALMYGNMWTIPVPDLQRADFMILMGANPQASQGSLMACADVLGELDRIRAEGGKVIVIDPRRTGTVRHASEWLPIAPGTDAALLLAVVNVLYADGLVDLGGLADIILGEEKLQALSAPFTPERVADACQIPADRIRELAHEIASAKRGVVYGRIGLCNQEFGTLASWLIDVVNILTGSFDVPGGLMFPTPVNWTVNVLPVPAAPGTPGSETGPEFGRWHSRVRGAPEVLGQVPVSCLAEEIDTPGQGQIKALITVAGNPALSAPGAERLQQALPMLDAMISVDNWINETTKHAHVILPGLSPLEQPHFDDLLWLFAVRSAGKWSEAIFPPTDGRPGEWEVLIRLGGILMGQKASEVDVAALDDGWFDFLVSVNGLDPATVKSHYTSGGPERLLDLSLRTGPWGDRYGENPEGITLQTFKDNPDGLDFGPMVPKVRKILRTPSGKLEIAPEYVTNDIPRLVERLDRGVDQLIMTSRRHLRSKNSWMHQVDVLVGGSNRCTLFMNPADATRCGVRDGEFVRVSSVAGSVDVELEVTDEMMAGVVSLPHGWGHTIAGAQEGVNRAMAGINNNLLAPVDFVDVPSGNAAVNGFPVTVTRVEVPANAGVSGPATVGART